MGKEEEEPTLEELSKLISETERIMNSIKDINEIKNSDYSSANTVFKTFRILSERIKEGKGTFVNKFFKIAAYLGYDEKAEYMIRDLSDLIISKEEEIRQIKLLQNENEAIRELAAIVLCKGGTKMSSKPLVDYYINNDDIEDYYGYCGEILKYGGIEALEYFISTYRDDIELIAGVIADLRYHYYDTLEKTIGKTIEIMKDDSAFLVDLVWWLRMHYKTMTESSLKALNYISYDSLNDDLKEKASKIKEVLEKVKNASGDVNRLIKLLKDEYTKEYAIKALGDLGDSKAADPLIETLIDPTGDYKRYYDPLSPPVIALVKIGGLVIEPLIKRLRKANAELKIEITKVLGKINNQQSLDILLKLLKDQSDEVVRGAVYALGSPYVRYVCGETVIPPLNRNPEWEEAVEHLLNLITYPNEGVWRSAISALGNIKNTKAVDSLLKYLKDENSFKRSEVIEALGEIGDTSVVEPLIKSLKEDNYHRSRVNAAYALGKLGDSRAIEPLIDALSDSKFHTRFYVGVEDAAIYALKELGDKRAIPLLKNKLLDNSLSFGRNRLIMETISKLEES